MSFFSPCGYRRPKQHLQRTLAGLRAAGLRIVMTQVVRSEAKPESAPDGSVQAVYHSDGVMFRKENLWNIGSELAWFADALIFVDADILFSGEDLVRSTMRALESHDIAQPFATAEWEDENGGIQFRRPAASVAIGAGNEPNPAHFHPGFAWAMRRSALKALNGFYDRNVIGGGDTMFAYALHAGDTKPNVHEERAALLFSAPSYVQYKANAQKAGLAVGYAKGVTAKHLWHGSHAGRQYVKRGNYLPALEGGELPLIYRQDGLMEWRTNEPSDRLLSYFKSRREDG